MADCQKTQEEIDAGIKKTLADAEQSLADARRSEEEAKFYAAQAKRELAVAGQEECDLAMSVINRDISIELRDRQLASDAYHNVYQFSGTVSDTSVKACMKELGFWHRQCVDNGCEPCPITIVFYSPGGSVFAGLALYDYITYLKAQGHHVTTICSGWAASMGAVLMQVGDTRVMGSESFMLLHEVSGGAIGSTGEIEDTVELIKLMNKRIIGIFAKRSKMSVDEIETRWNRKDWSMDSAEALELGLVDEIR